MILVYLLPLSLYPQKIITIGGELPEDKPTPQLPVDSAIYKVVYSMSYLPDASNRDNVKSGTTGLFIGKSRALFIDMTEVENDSLLAETRRKGGHSFNVMNDMMKNSRRKVFEPVIVFNYPEAGKVLFQSYISGDKRYIDEVTKQEWSIFDEHKNILGYSCRKATCRFRGRDYEVWYAEELPVPFGPYMFYGLPGLIFEIADTDREYDFRLLGLEKVSNPFLLSIDDYDVEMISRDDYRTMEYNKFNNPVEVMSLDVKDLKILDSSGNEEKQMQSIPYNPIEKE